MSKICTLPWIHMETTPIGEFRPCCLANEPIPDLNISKGNTLKDAFESEYMEDLRKQFLDGKQPSTCSKCWSLENSGGTSKRMISNQKFGINTEQKQLKFLDLKLGNICNLKCRICGAWSSSKWTQEEIDLGNRLARKWLTQGQWPRQQNQLWEEIIKLLPDIEYFEFTGGEPFLIKEHFDILTKSVELGTSKMQQIHYNTNGTTFPHHAIENIWPNFKEVEIAFSIDDIGDRFEYQRYGAKWDQVNENIKKFNELKQNYSNIKTQVCCTINIQNIYNLENIALWIEEQDFDFVFYNYLHEAKEWNVQYLPANYKKLIETKLLGAKKINDKNKKEIEQALVFMMDKHLGNDQMHSRRRQKILASDKFRNQSFVNTHPEYKNLL